MLKTIAKTIFKIDTFLYKKLGIVSYFRKTYWKKQAEIIQKNLNYQHAHRDMVNDAWGTDYTTRQSLSMNIW